eukprot:564928-Prymnesium_polylepis.2
MYALGATAPTRNPVGNQPPLLAQCVLATTLQCVPCLRGALTGLRACSPRREPPRLANPPTRGRTRAGPRLRRRLALDVAHRDLVLGVEREGALLHLQVLGAGLLHNVEGLEAAVAHGREDRLVLAPHGHVGQGHVERELQDAVEAALVHQVLERVPLPRRLHRHAQHVDPVDILARHDRAQRQHGDGVVALLGEAVVRADVRRHEHVVRAQRLRRADERVEAERLAADGRERGSKVEPLGERHAHALPPLRELGRAEGGRRARRRRVAHRRPVARVAAARLRREQLHHLAVRVEVAAADAAAAAAAAPLAAPALGAARARGEREHEHDRGASHARREVAEAPSQSAPGAAGRLAESEEVVTFPTTSQTVSIVLLPTKGVS